MASKTITVVDLGMSNVKSVINMYKKIGIRAHSSSHPGNNIPEYIVLPGVGSFDVGMRELKRSGWGSAIQDFAAAGKVPILGLCLGMQLLSDGSEEGEEQGLSVIPGKFTYFSRDEEELLQLKIPHMGWNNVEFNQNILRFLPSIPTNQRYYFVHSYKYETTLQENVVGTTNYGGVFSSAISSGMALGLQFHPEKSHRFGMELLKNLAGVKDA